MLSSYREEFPHLDIITFINENCDLLDFEWLLSVMVLLDLVEVDEGGVGCQLGDGARRGLNGGWKGLSIGAQRCAVSCSVEKWLDVGCVVKA